MFTHSPQVVDIRQSYRIEPTCIHGRSVQAMTRISGGVITARDASCSRRLRLQDHVRTPEIANCVVTAGSLTVERSVRPRRIIGSNGAEPTANITLESQAYQPKTCT